MKLTTIDTVIEKVLRDTQRKYISIDRGDYGNWIAEAIEQIGGHTQYEYNVLEKHTDDNGQIVMPCGTVSIRSVLGANGIAYTQKQLNNRCEGCNTFIYKHPYIRVNNENTLLKILYIGIPLDESGYPMLPEEVSFIEACSRYVIYKLKYSDYLNGNISENVYRGLERDWYHYCSQARGQANMPDIHRLENIRLMRTKLIPHTNAYLNGFGTVYTQQNVNY